MEGTWQGVLIHAGQKMDQGTVVYADFKINDGVLTGYMREETYKSNFFAVKQIGGTAQGNKVDLSQTVIERQNVSFRAKWCLNDASLEYDAATGYLKGSFKSTNCGRLMGEVILYRSDFNLSTDDSSHTTHHWFPAFVKDYSEGMSAPEIRKLERENFVFEPIYFDFDQAVIRDEYKEFLDRMIKVVKGHSDLRVLVTGHTDSDGSDGYNIGLSKRRAEALVNYFVANGLSENHLKFDFKGETDPAATNNTSEGRQRNRRVDFKFI